MFRESFAHWQIPREIDGIVLVEDLAQAPGRIGIEQRHRHAELELHLVAHGHGVFLVGRTRIDATPGTMLWVRPGEDHTLLEASRDFRRWMLLARRRVVRRVVPVRDVRRLLSDDGSQADGAGLCRALPLHAARTLAQRLAEVRSGSHGPAPLHNAAIAGVLAAAFTAYASASALPTWSALHPSVAMVVRLLCGGELSLSRDELARRCGLSPWHLGKLFREQVGVSLVDFRNRRRLERFLELYGDGTRTKMITAALDAGFGSYAQFHRLFRAVMQCSPAQYARQAPGPQDFLARTATPRRARRSK